MAKGKKTTPPPSERDKVKRPLAEARRASTVKPTVAASTRVRVPLGFQSWAHLIVLALLCGTLVCAPYFLSGFWPSDYDYTAQACFLSLTALTCLVLAMGGRLPQAGDDHLAGRLISVGLALFFGWCCLSGALGVYWHDAILELARIGGCLVWFFIIKDLLKPAAGGALQFRLRYGLVLVACATGLIIETAPAIFAFIVDKDHNPRQFGTFYNPNLLACYCAMAVGLALAGALELWRLSRTLTDGSGRAAAGMLAAASLAAAACGALGLLVTSSKGGILALSIALLVFAVALVRTQRHAVRSFLRAYFVPIVIFGALLTAGGGFVFVKTVLPRIKQMMTTDSNSTMFRKFTQKSTLAMATARPALGWGAGSYPSAYPQFAVTSYTRSAHQAWLQIAAESGFPALLLLLLAVGTAAVRAVQLLRSQHWPLALGSLAALVAFSVQGFTDSGWSITSIVLLLMTVLACVEAVATAEKNQAADAPQPLTATAGLNYSWLLVLVIAAGGGWATLRAVGAEEQRAAPPPSAMLTESPLDRAQQAVELDPLSGRMWANLGNVRLSLGQEPVAAYERAIKLQPTRASHYWLLASWYARQNNVIAAEETFARAIALEPNETRSRLSRGEWRVAHGDARGWDDLAFVADLALQPYGKYQPVGDFVNLDFTRAYVQLAPHLRDTGKKQAACELVRRGLADVALALTKVDLQRQLKKAVSGAIEVEPNDDLDSLKTQLEDLKGQLQC